MSSSPFPPMGPPAKSALSSTPSILQKTLLMKDALLDNTEMAVFAMWKDGSVMYPNAAARNLLKQGTALEDFQTGHDILPNWEVYDEEFTRRLDPDEFPISVLLWTETPFSNMRIGMYDANGEKRVLEIMGELIKDETTGETLAGVVTAHDVTDITQMITQIKEDDEERFKLICESMPQFVWTTDPDGKHDFFNNQWYSYTGLSTEDSHGEGWINSFHPDDLQETLARWKHSLRTGEQYMTEYRCRSKDGEWRWFLGRALPLKNKETGEIVKWFGKASSCPRVCCPELTQCRDLYRRARKHRNEAGSQEIPRTASQRHRSRPRDHFFH